MLAEVHVRLPFRNISRCVKIGHELMQPLKKFFE